MPDLAPAWQLTPDRALTWREALSHTPGSCRGSTDVVGFNPGYFRQNPVETKHPSLGLVAKAARKVNLSGTAQKFGRQATRVVTITKQPAAMERQPGDIGSLYRVIMTDRTLLGKHAASH